MQNCGDSRHSDDERGLIHSRYTSNDIDYRDNASPEIVPSRINVNSNSFSKDCRSFYGGSLSDHYNYGDSNYDPKFDPKHDPKYDPSPKYDPKYDPNLKYDPKYDPNPKFIQEEIIQSTPVKILEKLPSENTPIKHTPIPKPHDDTITGYKYTYNPSFDEETTTSKQDYDEVSSSPDTPSECLEVEQIIANRYKDDSSVNPGSGRGARSSTRNRTPSSRSNRNSDPNASAGEQSPKPTSAIVSKTNGGTFYKRKM